MNVEVITKEDLQAFRLQLINVSSRSQTKEWLKSSEVRKLLKFSPGKLKNLRLSEMLDRTGLLSQKILLWANISPLRTF